MPWPLPVAGELAPPTHDFRTLKRDRKMAGKTVVKSCESLKIKEIIYIPNRATNHRYCDQAIKKDLLLSKRVSTPLALSTHTQTSARSYNYPPAHTGLADPAFRCIV